MADETTSNFTGIEEDASTVADPEQHVRIEVNDYLGDSGQVGDSGLHTYLELGAWAPAAAPGTVVGGKLDAGATDAQGNPDPENGYAVDPLSGDDLLAPFLYGRHIDDTRDRFAADAAKEENKRATPAVNFAAYAQPPKVSAFFDAGDPDFADGTGFFPASTQDDHFFYSEPARQRLTEHTPETVGWRDHTEGHRISTTRGDKLEVIGGNYKLFVLGRGTGTVQTDWSGGMTIDTMEAPGLVTSVSWRNVPTGDDPDEHGWLWVEETAKGHVVERYHGTTRTEHYGDEIVTIIGRSDEDAPIEVAEATGDVGAFDPIDASTGFAEIDNAWDGGAGVPDTRPRPKVTSKVFASEVFELEQYDESITTITHAPSIDAFVGHLPDTDAATKWANKPSIDRDIVYGETIKETIYATLVEEHVEAEHYLLSASDASGGLGLTTEYWFGAFRERFLGAFTQMFLGAFISVGVGAKIDLSIGPTTETTLPLSVELSGLCLELWGAKGEFHLSRVKSRLAAVETRMQETQTKLNKAKLTSVFWQRAALHMSL